jgi:Phage tail tube protein, TTP
MMGYNFPEGSSFQFCALSDFAAAKTVTAITNAAEAVASATTHGYADNDELVFFSGWEDATDTMYRANQLTADTFGLVGLDSSSTSFFPTGGGAGTTQKVGTWSTIPQVLSIGTSGGDARFSTFTPLARRNALSVPIGFNPSVITLTMGHDASNATFAEMLAISRTLEKVGFKMVLGSGGTTYGFGYMAVQEFPALNSGQPNQVSCVLSLIGKAISYAT